MVAGMASSAKSAAIPMIYAINAHNYEYSGSNGADNP